MTILHFIWYCFVEVFQLLLDTHLIVLHLLCILLIIIYVLYIKKYLYFYLLPDFKSAHIYIKIGGTIIYDALFKTYINIIDREGTHSFSSARFSLLLSIVKLSSSFDPTFV